MPTRIVPVWVALLGVLAASCGGSEDTESSPDSSPVGSVTIAPASVTVAPVDTTPSPLTVSVPPTTDPPVADTTVTDPENSTSPTTDPPTGSTSASREAQESPEAVAEAYYEAANAIDADAMFALISPQRREGVAPSDWADCVSGRLTDISGAELRFEHIGTNVEDGSTFVEAVITLSEEGEGAVPSDDDEALAVPVAIEVVEIDGLWWTVSSSSSLVDSFSCL